jgi:glycosyltransferase involved in cell wall biosynthesis
MGSSFGFLTVAPDDAVEQTSFADTLAGHLGTAGIPPAVVASVGRHPAGRDGSTGRDGSARAVDEAASALAACDVVIVDHAIRAPSEADQLLLDVIERLRCPVIVRLSAVARLPSRCQRDMYHRLDRLSDAVVVPSGAARRRLSAAYAVVPRRIVLIADVVRPLARVTDGSATVCVPTVVTSGVLGPDRGLETAIDAIAGLRSLTPRPRYIIAAPTEPAMLTRDGEAYRHALMARTLDRGVASMVTFLNASDDGHPDPHVPQVDVVVITDVHPEQMKSRVVVDALAAGTPVVALMTSATRATAVAAGIERLVPAADPAALSRLLRFLLTDPAVTTAVARRRTVGPEPIWQRIADQYQELAAELVAARKSAMTDRTESLRDSQSL